MFSSKGVAGGPENWCSVTPLPMAAVDELVRRGSEEKRGSATSERSSSGRVGEGDVHSASDGREEAVNEFGSGPLEYDR